MATAPGPAPDKDSEAAEGPVARTDRVGSAESCETRGGNCGGRGQVSLDVETTVDEVVDVLHAVATAPADRPYVDCLVEAAWALDLPMMFTDLHAAYSVGL